MLGWIRRKRPGTPTADLVFYETIRVTVRVLLAVLLRSREFGVRRIPREGAVLLVANHQSYLDPPLISTAAGVVRQLEFIARGGLFEAHGGFGWLIRALHSIPIKEEGGDAAAIKEILRRLEEGRVVLIFPEGSRSQTGAMEAFKRGVAVLVKRSRCPVLPVAVEGCFDAWPPGQKAPRLIGQRIAVRFGRPIAHDELMKDGADAALRRLEAEVDRMRLGLRRMLRRLSGGRQPRRGRGDEPAFAGGGSGVAARATGG